MIIYQQHRLHIDIIDLNKDFNIQPFFNFIDDNDACEKAMILIMSETEIMVKTMIWLAFVSQFVSAHSEDSDK